MRFRPAAKLQVRGARVVDAEQLDRLLEAAGDGRLEAEQRDAAREVEARERVAARAGAAALERVVGEEADRRREHFRGDRGLGAPHAASGGGAPGARGPRRTPAECWRRRRPRAAGSRRSGRDQAKRSIVKSFRSTATLLVRVR